MKKVLFAGPWVGEFGWELFCWHAYVRSLSRFYDETVCVGPPHSEFMYRDFCDKYINFTPEYGDYRDSFYKVGFSIDGPLIRGLMKKAEISTEENQVSIFAPRRIGDPPRTHYNEKFQFGNQLIAPEYIKFGTQREEYKNTIIFHARNRTLRQGDNWHEDNWKPLAESLLTKGYEIVSIGLKSESLHIENTTDKRECDQQELLDILHSGVAIFGPSSGAMHLATLCGCSQIVWTTDYNLERYTKNWNPFETPVLFLSKHGWQPPPEYVFEEFGKWGRHGGGI